MQLHGIHSRHHVRDIKIRLGIFIIFNSEKLVFFHVHYFFFLPRRQISWLSEVIYVNGGNFSRPCSLPPGLNGNDFQVGQGGGAARGAQNKFDCHWRTYGKFPVVQNLSRRNKLSHFYALIKLIQPRKPRKKNVLVSITSASLSQLQFEEFERVELTFTTL